MVDQPSRQTLDLVPNRCITFVLAVAKYPAIAAALGQKGYSQVEHDFVWSRLTMLGALPSVASQGAADKTVRDAILELDAWDEPNFAIIRAALQRFFPAFVAIVFKDLEPRQGPEAVYSVSTLLDRLDTLETSTDPNAPAVLKLLSDRGYPKTERQRLRDRVTTVKTFTSKPVLSDAERVQILTELYAWITDWSTTAKAVIQRRQHLIALGIAAPRKSEKKAAAGAADATKGAADAIKGATNGAADATKGAAGTTGGTP